MKKIVILISGRGSNMEAIARSPLSDAQIAAVISNRPDAAGLEIARNLGIETIALDHKAFPDRESFDVRLMQEIDRFAPDLVVLAGYMRILTDVFVRHYAGKMMNIHPSLLPSFTGLHTHRRALEAGVRLHGATVHFVTPELDVGPIVIQAAVPVLAGDTEESLSARVQMQEHLIYPQAVRWFVEGRLKSDACGRIQIDNIQSGPAGWSVPPVEC